MTKKLIALDLDGTTLNNQSEISPKTQAVLTKDARKVHVVSIATGRHDRMSKNYYDQLRLNTPMVNFNGALVHKPYQKWAYEHEFSIKRELGCEILAQKDQLHLDVIASEDRETYFIDNLNHLQVQVFAAKTVTAANLLSNLTTNPTSLLVKTTHEYSLKVSTSLMHQFDDQVDVRTWGGPNAILEIVPKGVHKAMAVAVIAKDLNIAPKDIIAFGDEHNDVELLDYSGWGVGMRNGTKEVRSVANDVTSK